MTSHDPFVPHRIGDLAEVFDGPHATPRKVDQGPWYLNIASLKNGRLDLSESAHIHADDVAKWTARVKPKRGDTLFSYETRLGESAFWDRNDEAVLGRRMGLLRPREDKVDPRFLAYAYLSDQFQEAIRIGTLHGATVNRIPVGDLPNWEIMVPSLPEQRRIAGVLGAFDDLIETNRRLADAIAALVASTYEVELASTANRVHLSDVSRHLPGKYLPKKTYEAGGPYPVYGSNSVMGSYTSYLYAGPLTVMARIGSNCGALRLSESSAWINNNASAIKAIDPRMQVRLHEALRRVEMDNHRAGTGQPFIRTESLMGERIPWPTKPSPWDAASGDLVEVAAALEEESGDLIRQRDELLPLLMSGKVRVSEVEGVA